MTEIKAFPMIEQALLELIEDLMPDSKDRVGGDLSYETDQEFYIWLGLVGGATSVLDGEWIIDIDVFDNHYAQAMNRALALEALLLRRGGHRTTKMIFDNVTQNEIPLERPWDDESAYRVGATYTLTARRRDAERIVVVPPAPVPSAGTLDPEDLPALDVDPTLMFENALM